MPSYIRGVLMVRICGGPASIWDRTDSPYFLGGVTATSYFRVACQGARGARGAQGGEVVRGGVMADVGHEFEVCPDRDQVRLQVCGGRQLLVHLQTCEVKYLDPAGAPWTLSFDTEGSGFIHAGPTSLWVDDILKECLCSAEDGSLFVIAGEDQPHWPLPITGVCRWPI